ncbi:MAG: cell division protein FtsW [Alphaproteobacteria bacterium]|nr:cell division protein FtsW [Alphaproteobacteria bacterium]
MACASVEPGRLSRTDASAISRWWWTVDHWTLGALLGLMGIGAILIMAASPAVAERIDVPSYHFVARQIVFLAAAAALMFMVSLGSVTGVRRLAGVVLMIGFVLLALTLVAGAEVKGARRWVALGSWLLQPSEFVKPAFAVFCAWALVRWRERHAYCGVALGLPLVALLGTLAAQPDVGMAVAVAAVFLVQLFVAGLPQRWILAAAGLAIGGGVLAYAALPHVTSRIDRFLDPASGDNYQVHTALQAWQAGGLFGRGPGEGIVKSALPDAHADFVFAVAGEEFGMLAGLAIIALFAFIVLRNLSRIVAEQDAFIVLAGTGLIVQFGLQALINIGVNLDMLPTKGMTLPFISYGGSSALAVAFGMGMLLALTRRRAIGAVPHRYGMAVRWARAVMP